MCELVEKSLTVFKIMPAEHWSRMTESGRLPIEGDDLSDGYVHLSTPSQVARTAARFFAGRTDLVLAAIPVDRLGAALRWERSASGSVYPHLHGDLVVGAVASVVPLVLGADGRHILPGEVTSC